MIDTKDVIEFFDRLAPAWDGGMVRDEAVIAAILDAANVAPGVDVLDVACGTGVAQGKFAGDDRITVLCRDAQTMDLGRTFDRILIYNAFPHFSNPEVLFETLARHLAPGGRLTVAHGMSRERINAHHQGGASRVSGGLPPVGELSALLAACLTVDRVVSDEAMYLVSGVRNGTNV